ncbi:unnamed protein product [Linum trigynum]|uniref:Uncharacterized protein n=1 Tax=Linum trigynum TaxID=586398 RepID=A0AAV2CI67_9ROSI
MEPAPTGRGARWIRTRVVARGCKKKAGSLTTARSATVDFDGGRMKDIMETSARPSTYPPKRRGISAIRQFPLNCGRRGGDGLDGGEKLHSPTVAGEALPAEEEEEPEEWVFCGFGDREEDDGDGVRNPDVDGGGGVQVSVLPCFWRSMASN